jgi:glycerol-3-phosphate acyltransferase PlsY
MIILFLSLLVFAYLCGSFSSAIIVCKIMGLPDPRTQGSGNPGATNVLRMGGKAIAAAVLILDAFKGLAPLVVAKIFLSNPLLLGFVGLAAVLGHSYPLFFKFQGGKGVATLIGVLLGIYGGLGLAFLVIWFVMSKLFRYSSLAALTATALTPFLAWFMVSSGYFLPLLLIAVLVFYRHSGNIQRLMNRTEPKIGDKT